MAGDLVRFVDAISASPTTRLDLNDETTWWCAEFSAPTPRLRRAMSSNAMRDGVSVSSSQYDSRVITMRLEARNSTQDLNATELQKLFRELDRPNNFIKYQPTGATKPVFFKTYRSDTSQLDDIRAQTAMRSITIELLAEPFALGLDETWSSSFTFDGSVSTSFEYACPTILGDVTAPLVLDISQTGINKTASFWLASQAFPTAYTAPTLKRLGTNAGLPLGTDTTTTTGAGTGFWGGDYVSTSFATATMVSRVVRASPGLISAGTYRVLARVTLSAASTVNVQLIREVQTAAIPTYATVQTGSPVSVPGTATYILDLGLFRVPTGTENAGPSSGLTFLGSTLWTLLAERTAGAGALRTDGLLFVPTIMDDAVSNTSAVITGGGASLLLPNTTLRLDADAGRGTILNSTTLAEVGQGVPAWSGTLPTVSPGCNNHLWLIPSGQETTTTATTVSFTGTYKPRYLFVRPSAS